jgi:hypothetical protein
MAFTWKAVVATIDMKALLLLPFLVCFFPAHLRAQEKAPLLERRISVSVTNERLDMALRKIAHEAGLNFSYSPAVIETGKLITRNYTNSTIREILDDLFQGSVEYKVRTKHIILTKAKTISEKSDDAVISGYVIDEATGERLKNVSVYDPVTLSSAVTDSYGYFQIKINKPPTDVKLSVNKTAYNDTTIAVAGSNRRLLNIPIHIDKKKIAVVADSVGQKIKRFWKTRIMNPAQPNVYNIQDSLFRQFQFSFVPFVGTNHTLSGNVINDYSINLIGGYAKGTRKAELGGLFNINRHDASYAQVAGGFNMVGGKFTGLQIAGAVNANYGFVFGGQVGGLANINWNGIEGGGVTGGVNFTRVRSSGAHIAGLGNFTLGEQEGPHVAGLFNFTTADSDGLQLSGAFNFSAKSFEGLQASGIFNFTANNISGSQIGGVLNFTGRHVRGSQVAGVLNFASTVRGSQLALVNICDSINGVPMGLFSLVLKGYHKLEISADEIFYTNLAFRTGVRKFYNILTAGAKPKTFDQEATFWTFGYGIGTARRISRWLSFNIDLTANQVMDQKKIEALNLLNKLHLGFDLHVSRNFSLAFAGTLNGQITESAYDGYKPLFSEYQPSIIYDKGLGDSRNLRMWLGGKVGLRFL